MWSPITVQSASLEIADIILDNGALRVMHPWHPEFPIFPQGGAASTVPVLYLNAIVVRLWAVAQAGHKPPVYVSGNVEGEWKKSRLVESR